MLTNIWNGLNRQHGSKEVDLHRRRTSAGNVSHRMLILVVVVDSPVQPRFLSFLAACRSWYEAETDRLQIR